MKLKIEAELLHSRSRNHKTVTLGIADNTAKDIMGVFKACRENPDTYFVDGTKNMRIVISVLDDEQMF